VIFIKINYFFFPPLPHKIKVRSKKPKKEISISKREIKRGNHCQYLNTNNHYRRRGKKKKK